MIGAGGKIINKIIAEFDVQIDIEDDGHVMVSGVNIENAQKAVEYIKSLVKEYVPGEKVTGKVVRVEAFGAFLQITAQTDGLIHVSELAPYRVESVADFVKIGDELTAMVREVNDKGQVSLTLKGVEENAKLWVDGKGKSSGDGGGGDRRSASRDGGYNHGGGGGRFQDRGPRRDSGYKSRT
ncbi:MAG: S1 RNA-binding domain-containing protein [Candidatus Falkowbacteria bacterium]|nr:S1 RNA-binding domain-containing protein [Candidatus Falkowbacteria bacterium]